MPWYYSDPLIGRSYAKLTEVSLETIELKNVDASVRWKKGYLSIIRKAPGKKPLGFSTSSRIQTHPILLFTALLIASWRRKPVKLILYLVCGIATFLIISSIMFSTWCLYPFTTMKLGIDPQNSLYYIRLFNAKQAWIFYRLSLFHATVGRELYAMFIFFVILLASFRVNLGK